MKTKFLWLLWLYLFAQCAVLGFVPEPPWYVAIPLALIAVAFYIPGFLLLRAGNRGTAVRIVIISGSSLLLTVVFIILNYASSLISGTDGQLWGQIFYIALGILSSPMFCSQIWVLSLFGWAFLLNMGIQVLRRKQD